MKPLLESKTILLTLVLALAFFPFAAVIPPSPLFEFLHAIRATVAMALFVIFSIQVVKMLRHGALNGVLQFSIGMGLLAFAAIGGSLWALTWRVLNYPRWMANHDVNAWFLWLGILGVLYVVTAPSRAGEVVQMRWWTYAVVGFIAGLIFATFLAFINPATSWIGHSLTTNGPAGVLDGFLQR